MNWAIGAGTTESGTIANAVLRTTVRAPEYEVDW